MLTSPKLQVIQDLIAGYSREELIWLNGYLAGMVARIQQSPEQPLAQVFPNAALPASEPENNTPAAKLPRITIAYGTETGNSKRLAADFASRAKKKGIQSKLVGLEQYRLNDLSREEYFFTIISTQGDGEPPASAKKFYTHIHNNGLRLEQLKYGVLALGDTAYPLFCQAGEDVDNQFLKAGAQRIVPLQKCDTDYEENATHWFDLVLQKLLNPVAGASIPNPTTQNGAVSAPRKPSGKKIYAGTILTNINLNDQGSGKRTHHLEIAADDASYQPGDSIGITPENPAAIVDAILALTGVDGDTRVQHRNENYSVIDLLKKRSNIVYLPERVVKKYAGIVNQEIPETRIGLLDLLKIYPVKNSQQFLQVLEILEPITPRLYSISSSPEAHTGEIHLTVAKDTFTVNAETKHGLCSEALCQLQPEEKLEFYVHHNLQFRLPAPDKDIIMIGPGTGIAPFRSFLAQRDATGAEGRNWLFFGDQHFTTDFLYQTEIQNWLQTGVLTRVNTAFSRDQRQKVYVQHKMLEHSATLYEWLQSGAYLYLCGAAEPMSQDVEATLLEIIRAEGNKSEIQAAAWLDELKETGRFVKDVY